MKPSLRLLVTFGIVGATALSAHQPVDPPATEPDLPDVTFRVEVNYVEIDALVTDASGEPLTDLTAADFELREEGVPQEIASFAMVNLPLDRADRPLYTRQPIEPDIRSNTENDGRIYLILLDDLHVHPTRARRVRELLTQFVTQNVGSNDLAAVVSARGSSGQSQDFTNNPRLLLDAVRQFTGMVPFEAPESTFVVEDEQLTPVDPARLEEAYRARTLMSSIRRLADFLAGIRGRRKTMILVSEGIGYDIHQVTHLAGGVASGVLEDSERAVAALTRANVSLYAVDPRGMLDAERLADEVRVDESGFRRAQDSLRVLAAATGGFAALNQNEFGNAFDRIVGENSAYYILGYYPTNERRDGKFRSVDVRVTRPGVQVRSRPGYIAPRGGVSRTPDRRQAAAASTVARALSSPLPLKGVPIIVFAAPFRGSARKAVVELAIEFDPANLGFTEIEGKFVKDLQVMHTVTEPGGTVHEPSRHDIRLALEPSTFERVKTRGMRLLSRIELEPGRYQLRTAVGTSDGSAGSVIYDLEVPDLQNSRLEMSGLLLTSTLLSRVDTIRPRGPMRGDLPGPIVAAREFESTDEIELYGEIYENAPSTLPHTIDIVIQLRTEDGRALGSELQQRLSNERRQGAPYSFKSQLRLADLAPGSYVIHVEARSSLDDRPTVSRHLRIRVKPPSSDCGPAGRNCRIADVVPVVRNPVPGA